jgi:hypothetical protein
MPAVLTTASTVVCGTPGPNHRGTVALVGNAKLKVAGHAVVLAGNVGPGVQNCGTPASNSTKPCATATPSGGEASKLTVDNVAVMLDTVAGTTNGNPAGAIEATANQTTLNAS